MLTVEPSKAAAVAEEIYQQLQGTFDRCCDQGQVSVDPYLQPDCHDDRRGLSLILRPAAATLKAVEALQRTFLPSMAGQYFYPMSDLHTTVLSVVPVSSSADYRADLAAYIKMVGEVMTRYAEALAIDYRGVVVTDEAVLIKGYPRDDRVQQLRQDLLDALRQNGLEQDVSRRYVSRAAHITCMRFTGPVKDFESLRQLLVAHAETPIGDGAETGTGAGSGAGTVIELVENDWYMRRDTTDCLARFTRRDLWAG